MLSLPEEQWRAIPGREGEYEASNMGRVRSVDRIRTQASRWGGTVHRRLRGAIKKPGAVGNYLHVSLGKDCQEYVHRLVAVTWLGQIPKGMQVNHKNGIPTDNRLENLEIVTAKQNITHAIASGLITNIGESHCNAIMTDEIVRAIRSAPKSMSARQIGIVLGLPVWSVLYARSGRGWKHVKPVDSDGKPATDGILVGTD